MIGAGIENNLKEYFVFLSTSEDRKRINNK